VVAVVAAGLQIESMVVVVVVVVVVVGVTQCRRLDPRQTQMSHCSFSIYQQ
jgi:hypothetical protein